MTSAIFRWSAQGWLTLALVCACSIAEAEDNFRAAFREAVAAKERAQDSKRNADWQEALERLRAANQLRETPEVGYEIGVAAANLGHNDLAVEAYKRSIELGLSGQALVKASSYVSDHEAEMATLTATGRSGCVLLINGIERAKLPQERPLVVQRGAAKLDLWCAGKHDQAKQLTLSANQHTDLELYELEPNTATSTPEEAAIASVLPLASTSLRAPVPITNRRRIGIAPSSNTAAPRWHGMGYALVGGGTSLVILSATLIPLTAARIKSSQARLLELCAKQVEGPDSCLHSKSGAQADAQAASDSIATWEMARTMGWIGLASGLTAAATGAAILLFAPNTRRVGGLPLEVSFEPQRLNLTWRGGF